MKSGSQRRFTGLPRVQGGRERLAFTFNSPTVPGRGLVDAAIAADSRPTFATVAHEDTREWGYVGLLAFTAVLLLRPQDQLPFLVPLHIAELAAIAGIGPMVMHRIARRLPVFRINLETVALMAFGFVMLVTVPFSVWPGGALAEFTDNYLKVIIVFVLMINTLSSPQRIGQLMWLILLCIGYISARGVFDYARGINLVENGRLTASVGGVFGNPNDLALNLVTFMPAAIIIALSRRFSALRRMTAAVIVLLMLATIVFTKSRGGLIGLVAMLIALVFLGRRIRRGFGVTVIGAVLIASIFAPSSFWVRMASIVDERQDQTEFTGSREARRTVMLEGLSAFMERPLTGVGLGQFKNYNPSDRRAKWTETHNALIQVAADTGIGGLAAFVFLIGCAAVAASRTRRMLTRSGRRNGADPLEAAFSDENRELLYMHTVAMSAGLVGWFTCAIFASVAYNWTFYYLLALIAAAREITAMRLAVARRFQNGQSLSVPAAILSRRWATGAA